MTPSPQEMTVGFRSATGGSWTLQALDRSGAQAQPVAAFTRSGGAFVLWRPSLASAPTTVYAAYRPPTGPWQLAQPISSPTAADTRYPRICVDSAGAAVAMYEEKASTVDPFLVRARFWYAGLWSLPGTVQHDSNEGRFATCVRYESNSFLRNGVSAVWRETDPSDATKFRIVTAK